MSESPERLIKWAEVAQMVPMDRTTVLRMEAAGRFPARRQLGPKSVAWLESEVLSWIRDLPQVTENVINPKD